MHLLLKPQVGLEGRSGRRTWGDNLGKEEGMSPDGDLELCLWFGKGSS